MLIIARPTGVQTVHVEMNGNSYTYMSQCHFWTRNIA